MTQYSLFFKLEDRMIGDVKVAGLMDLIVGPRGEGIGRQGLLFIEAVASPKIVACFVDPKTVLFFEKCGWYIGNLFNRKFLVASEPIDDNRHSGEIW